MAPVIEARNLAKHYPEYSGLANSNIKKILSSIFTRIGSYGVKASDAATQRWALKDISFTVEPGERVGLVGKNGAGKSTLLKILARVLEPTSGQALLRGRIASLLEVGTGFHMDLTGRENVFFSGAILGMSRKKIRKKFESIVEFAEIGDVLDMPMRTYSSGMYIRLAFAVAAFLDADTLLVDEVLAVGDAHFQRKCITRMTELSNNGTTIVLVSHVLGLVSQFCSRCLWIDNGELQADGPASTVVERYLESALGSGAEHTPMHTEHSGVQLTYAALFDQSGKKTSLSRDGECLRLEFLFRAHNISEVRCGYSIMTPDGLILTHSVEPVFEQSIGMNTPPSEQRISVGLPTTFLNSGLYRISIDFYHRDGRLLQSQEIMAFLVHRTSVYEKELGILNIQSEWLRSTY